MSVDGSRWLYLLLTPSNTYQLLMIDFSTGDYTKTDALEAIPGVSAFDNTLTNLRADFD